LVVGFLQQSLQIVKTFLDVFNFLSREQQRKQLKIATIKTTSFSFIFPAEIDEMQVENLDINRFTCVPS